MAKKLVPTQYVFDSIANTVKLKGNVPLERLLVITDVTINVIIYNFADPTKGASVSYDPSTDQTTVTLTYDVSAAGAANSDNLQIFIEEDAQTFKPDETYLDPVSKIRVSNPENLIDTDFEYGLQSTKWETLELVKNIPTFFSRNGDEDIAIDSITSVNGSEDVTVVCLEMHNLSVGTPVIVQGTTSVSASGQFIVTGVIDDYTFIYKAKRRQTFTGTISETYTQVFLASVYQGTEFRIGNIDSISVSTAGGTNDTVITVDTEFPAPMSVGTNFFLANSLGVANFTFDATQTITSKSTTINQTTLNNSDVTRQGFSKMDVQPYDFTGSNILYFQNSDITVNQTEDTITFNSAHGLTDDAAYVYVAGEGNTGFATEYRGYIVRVLDATTIYLTTDFGLTSRINLSAVTDGGLTRSAFIRAYKVASIRIVQNDVNFDTNDVAPPFITNGSDPILVFGSANDTNFMLRTTDLKNVSETTNSSTQVFYSVASASSGYRWTFSRTPQGQALDFLSGTNNAYYFVPASRLVDANSINFPSHNLPNGSLVSLSATIGSLPTGLSATTYVAEVVNPNTLRFLGPSSGTIANITSVGVANDQYTITGTIANSDNDSLFVPVNKFTDGQSVTYDEDGNGVIGGLTDNQSYFVFQRTVNRLKLATTSTGFSGGKLTGNHSSYQSANDSFVVTGHGLSDSETVQYLSSTPMAGLTNGAFYHVDAIDANTIRFYYDSALTSPVDVDNALGTSGTFTVQKSTLVDLTAAGTGSHILKGTAVGASDGVYEIARVNSSQQFEFDTGRDIPNRVVTLDVNSGLDLQNNRFYVLNHGFVTGSAVTYAASTTAITGLTTATVYYVIRVNKDWFKLATTRQNALDGVSTTLTDKGTGTHTLTTNSITGEITGPGTVTFLAGQIRLEGTGTNFTSIFSPGDKFNISIPQTLVNVAVTADAGTDQLTAGAAHNINTGDAVIMNATAAPAGTTNGYIYYARAVNTTVVTLHPTPADASGNTNIVNLTDAGTSVTLDRITDEGSVITKDVNFVNSAGSLEFADAFAAAGTDLNYFIGTSLTIRSDGFALHRPYDGGVELIPSSNPDATIIRQTRKYFRYQSGKGIQNSLAVNFSPVTDIDTFSRVGTTGTVTTRSPHRLTAGLSVTVTNATVTSGTNYWNDTFTVDSIVNDYAFTVTLAGTPVDNAAGGIPRFYVEAWENSRLQCGLFDDQNGIFWEFDGQQMYACRRSSIQQLSGTAGMTFRSSLVTGTNTKFRSQVSVGDKIVIKGQTYEVAQVDNDTTMYILPSYRGSSQSNVVITKTETTRTPQSQWNLDKCDGTGKSGFILDVHKIQMVYIDYSWYGAGKVRYGFKDQYGNVKYVHEYIHNNQFTEAYMRSGNLPGRYQIQNIGTPTYVPALAHWGTSIIMDGRFDDDKAYVFTAASNDITLLGTGNTVNVSARAETTDIYEARISNNWREVGYALQLENPDAVYNTFTAGMAISGADVSGATILANPTTSRLPAQPYQPGLDARTDLLNRSTRNLLVIDQAPTGTAGAYSTYVVTLSEGGDTGSVLRDLPLISIRLAPSVDTNTPGYLGEREIINRMQLILSQVQILTTHAVDVKLVLNGQIDNNTWQRVTNPSLSQLIYHTNQDSIVGGSQVYSFRAEGGTGTSGRTAVSTREALDEVATLGNSIMGGDGLFPDGPDVLTVVATLREDPSTVSLTNQFNISGRISWTESQA